jgi:hypothetical protein
VADNDEADESVESGALEDADEAEGEEIPGGPGGEEPAAAGLHDEQRGKRYGAR